MAPLHSSAWSNRTQTRRHRQNGRRAHSLAALRFCADTTHLLLERLSELLPAPRVTVSEPTRHTGGKRASSTRTRSPCRSSPCGQSQPASRNVQCWSASPCPRRPPHQASAQRLDQEQVWEQAWMQPWASTWTWVQSRAHSLPALAMPSLRSRSSGSSPHTALVSWKELMASALVPTPVPAWARARAEW